jgi:hypothetical protein
MSPSQLPTPRQQRSLNLNLNSRQKKLVLTRLPINRLRIPHPRSRPSQSNRLMHQRQSLYPQRNLNLNLNLRLNLRLNLQRNL